jgi:hypothetical protein
VSDFPGVQAMERKYTAVTSTDKSDCDDFLRLLSEALDLLFRLVPVSELKREVEADPMHSPSGDHLKNFWSSLSNLKEEML